MHCQYFDMHNNILVTISIFFLSNYVVALTAEEELDMGIIYPELEMTAPEIISYMGYPAETHTATSFDGYMIELHRIPAKSSKKPPILLQHGLLSSSDEYIINYPNQSLAYILSDAGYNVWLGNYRGNIYSTRHIKYNSNDPEFWNFEMNAAFTDLGTEIDYVLNETHHKQLYYVGFSLGSTGIYGLLSREAQYNSKVKYIISLAPAANTRYVRGIFPTICNYISRYGLPLSWRHQVPPNLKQVRREICKTCFGKRATLCKMILGMLVGPMSEHINMTRLPLLTSLMLGGTSYSIMRLTCQVVSAKDVIRDYDYGQRQNMIRYGQIKPTIFNLSQITSPVFIYHSDGDFLSTPDSVKFISESIRNFQGSHLIEEFRYSHLDFVVATNNKALLHDKIVARLHEYESKNPTYRTQK